jgi:outer membrane protein OmpA-like peptidoglycan-associated protein
MKRYILTESQLNKIVQKRTNELVNENEIIEEGIKELALAVLLSTVTSTGLAQKMGKNPKEVAKIEMIQQKAAEDLARKEGMDYKEALQLIKQAEKDYEKGYDKKLGDISKTMKGDTQADLARVLANLKNGYAIKGIHKDTIVTEIPAETFVEKVDTQSVTLDGENFFQQGSFELNDSTKTQINQILESLNQGGRMVVGITIESSTDKERVSDHLEQRLVAMGYDEGNQGLSEVRNDKMKEFVMSSGVDEGVIEQDIKWEQGVGELGAETPQDASARYVKVHFFFIETPPTSVPQEPTEEVTIVTVFG